VTEKRKKPDAAIGRRKRSGTAGRETGRGTELSEIKSRFNIFREVLDRVREHWRHY